jgi:[ribosomal protein S5]-alanine N-acetyltransferase
MALFESDRLIVRRIAADDLAAMVAVYGDPETVRYVGDSKPLDAEGCRRWIEITDQNFERRGYGMVAIVERESGEVIGFAGIVHPGQQLEAELKYALRRDRWGRGYAFEVVVGLVRYAREAWGVGSIIATVDPDNAASQRVLAKAGFAHSSDRANDDGTRTQVWTALLGEGLKPHSEGSPLDSSR